MKFLAPPQAGRRRSRARFAAVAPHILYRVNAYAEFGMFGDVAPLTDPQQLIASGPVVDCFSWTLFPGEPLERAPDASSTSLPESSPLCAPTVLQLVAERPALPEADAAAGVEGGLVGIDQHVASVPVGRRRGVGVSWRNSQLNVPDAFLGTHTDGPAHDGFTATDRRSRFGGVASQRRCLRSDPWMPTGGVPPLRRRCRARSAGAVSAPSQRRTSSPRSSGRPAADRLHTFAHGSRQSPSRPRNVLHPIHAFSVREGDQKAVAVLNRDDRGLLAPTRTASNVTDDRGAGFLRAGGSHSVAVSLASVCAGLSRWVLSFLQSADGLVLGVGPNDPT